MFRYSNIFLFGQWRTQGRTPLHILLIVSRSRIGRLELGAQSIYILQCYESYYTQQVCLNCLPSSLLQLMQQLVDEASSYLCAPNLLYKPILIAYLCLNRLTRVFVFLGYIDSVINKVLILLLRQVYQELEPSKGVRFLESSVAAIIYYTPQLLLLRVTCNTLTIIG